MALPRPTPGINLDDGLVSGVATVVDNRHFGPGGNGIPGVEMARPSLPAPTLVSFGHNPTPVLDPGKPLHQGLHRKTTAGPRPRDARRRHRGTDRTPSRLPSQVDHLAGPAVWTSQFPQLSTPQHPKNPAARSGFDPAAISATRATFRVEGSHYLRLVPGGAAVVCAQLRRLTAPV